VTTATQKELLEDIALLLRHRDVVGMLNEQRMLEKRAEAQKTWLDEQREKRREVVITDDAAPAPGSIYLRMGEQDLLKAIASLKDEAVRTGDYTRVQIAESVLNERRLEKQRAMLKGGAESMTAFQR
jgi:hypothetical protein